MSAKVKLLLSKNFVEAKAWVFPVPRVQAQAFFDLSGFSFLGFSWTTGPGSGPGQ